MKIELDITTRTYITNAIDRTNELNRTLDKNDDTLLIDKEDVIALFIYIKIGIKDLLEFGPIGQSSTNYFITALLS